MGERSRRKHPDVPGCVVRLTDDAVTDLKRLHGADPQIVRWALKKMLHLERNPNAGQPLLGGLIGYRKITVGNRDWRIVWKVVEDEGGGFVIEVAEVWAVGYRKDAEVYEEISRRVTHAGSTPTTRALSDVLTLFTQQARGLSATVEPAPPEPVPRWLNEALVHVVHLPRDRVERMSLAEAEETWSAFTSGPGSTP